MAYSKHTWVHNETITAANLNHIEQGIYENDQAIRHYVTPIFLTETLTAGETTVVFTSEDIIGADSITLYTDNGVAPTSQMVSGDTFTATFEAQAADMEVSIEVK